MNKKKINTKKGVALWNKAKRIIPGGNQLLSKRSEMYLPGLWPSYFKKAKGIEVWDLDGSKYLDFTIMGIGSCVLGYADDDVNKAVKKVVDDGSMNTLNSPEEVELAELLLKLHPWAEMVRYARTGGESMAVAVRIARAYSGKDKIAFCGYHGWSDWYLASNLASDKNLDGHLLPGLEPKGVPRALKGTAVPFNYNSIEELKKIVKKHKDIGVIITEPIRHQEPKNNFLGEIRKIADKIGAVMIIDEISAGWKLNVGGAHLLYGVKPDIAVYAKAMGNGYPMAAIIGKKKVMQAAQDTFISSTYWTERIGPTAALATIKKMKSRNVPAHLKKIGKMIGEGWSILAQKHGLDITVVGPENSITFSFNYDKDLPVWQAGLPAQAGNQALRTLFTQEMLKRGYLAAPSVYVSYAHKKHHIKPYLKAVDEVFAILKDAIDGKKIYKLLKGPVAHSDFKRLT